MLILTPFTKALKSLEIALKAPESDMSRDSSIQRFEYTFELSIKMLRRYLELSADTTTSVDELAYRELIRIGAEKGCILHPKAWFKYRDARNITSHAYDIKKAKKIYRALPAFAKDARTLHDALIERIAKV